jgi:hypothetical protein
MQIRTRKFVARVDVLFKMLLLLLLLLQEGSLDDEGERRKPEMGLVASSDLRRTFRMAVARLACSTKKRRQ